MEPLVAAKANESHQLNIEPAEDKLYVSPSHEMKKEHYISFAAYVTGDKVFMVKQYPEWNLQFRLQKFGHGKLYFCVFRLILTANLEASGHLSVDHFWNCG